MLLNGQEETCVMCSSLEQERRKLILPRGEGSTHGRAVWVALEGRRKALPLQSDQKPTLEATGWG